MGWPISTHDTHGFWQSQPNPPIYGLGWVGLGWRAGISCLGAPMDSSIVMFMNSINLSINSVSCATESSNSHLWMMDLGCSHTMTHMRHIFIIFTPLHLPVSSATGAHFWTEGYGEVWISLTNPDRKSIGSMHLQNTWLAPDLAHNLIFIHQLACIDIKTVFDEFEKVQLL